MPPSMLRWKALKEGNPMPTMTYADAIEDALAFAMASDPRVVVFGEDSGPSRIFADTIDRLAAWSGSALNSKVTVRL